LNVDRFTKIKKLLLETAGLSEDERRVYLDEACKDDPELRGELESILSHEKDQIEILKTGGGIPPGLEEPTESSDMTGQTLSHFRIEEKIATGGMGVLYRAVDLNLRRKVAIKVLRPEILSQPSSRERFVREARAASTLNHPGIVTVYEIGEDSGFDFIAMEYVEGRTLGEVISPQGLPIESATAFTLEIAKTLQAAHEKGIVHRDLKPSNIMIAEVGGVKILDFGIAKQLGSAVGEVAELPTVTQITQTGGVVGTADYMSPEQVEGKEVDTRSDIFSLGIILYELFTGQPPFRRATAIATAHAIVYDDPEPINQKRKDVPNGLQRIVTRSLAKRRDDRYQKTEDLVEELRRFQRSQKVLNAPMSIDTKEKREVESLAVLYLKNLGSAKDEYLSYGITEDLIVDLTRIGTLRVAPMRSILKHKDSNEDIEEIAGKLDVKMVLDGSIHKSERSVRISAQLVDIETGKNLWANRWEVPDEKLPQVKQSLAEEISRALKFDSMAIETAQVGFPEARDPRAYECYLRGKYTFERKKDKEDVEAALGFYRRALAIEPSLLAARAGVSRALIHKAEYDHANRELTSALADARRHGMRADEAVFLELLASLHTAQSRWDEAWEYGERALEIRRGLGDLSGEAEVLGILIDILRGRAKFSDALKLSKRVLEINRQLADREKAAHALLVMGTVYWRIGEYDHALALTEEAQEIAHKCDDTLMEAHCVMNVGVIYSEMGNLDDALQRFEIALNIFTNLGEKEHRASLFNNIALIHMARGEYREALGLYEEAAAVANDLGNRANYALYLDNIAIILTITGDCNRAIQVADEAMTIATDLDYPLVVAVAYLAMGIAHFYRREEEKAKNFFYAAMEIAGPAGHRREIGVIQGFLGELYYVHQDHDSCKEHSEKALTIAKEVGEKTTQLKAPAYLAALMAREGLFGAGIRRLREINTKANEYGDPLFILVVRRLLGQVLLECGQNHADREEGRSILEEALSLAREREVAYEIDWIGQILNG
jgi:serine/threonine protein kinase/Tfp pilus assembly protein PilF